MVRKPKETKPESLLSQKLKEIEKEFGSGAIIDLSQDQDHTIDTISTGSFVLDKALGVGGLPKGRIIEVYSSQESSSKTTLALSVARECQRTGGKVAIIDSEHALDLGYAKMMGVDIEELLISQPDFAEQAMVIAEKLIESNEVQLLIIDSVAALTPKAEVEGEMGDSHMALLARLMSQALRKLTSKVHKSNCTVIFINQMRQNIKTFGFGEKWVTCGGVALKFYSSVRIRLTRIATLKDSNDSKYGITVKAEVVKNKVAAPYKTAEFNVMFTEGLSQYSDTLKTAMEYGIVTKKGAWYYCNDNQFAQGEKKALEHLKINQKFYSDLKTQIIELIEEE